MAEEILWTREQQENTLAGISVIRAAQPRGQHAGPDTARAILEAVRQFNEPTDADALARLVTGLTNTACLLLDWIEAEAQNKQILLQEVRQSIPDFEEPGTYPTDPDWSEGLGVLRAVEKTVREVPLSD
jgi:hypothetical protein